jgi:hypothetical protein
MMNINNVIKALRQSRKLQAVSIYYSEAQPSIPASREFFDEITPTLKLLLKAFKQAYFEAYISRWGELTLFSQRLGLEILIRIEPNTQYMSQVSKTLLEKNGYQVLDVQVPRNTFVLNYFFCGTKSKWRQIPFDLNFDSVESVYIIFVQPIIKISKGFQGRLQSSLQQTTGKHLVTQNTVYAFARYAANTMSKVYGLAQYCTLSESKYVGECFFGSYGAILVTDYWQGLHLFRWHKNDLTYLRKHIPEMFEPHSITCSSISDVTVNDDEHLFLLESLDKALFKKHGELDEAENWLNEPQYFTDKMAPRLLLNSIEGATKILLTIVR